jgi:TatD DNase family protein
MIDTHCHLDDEVYAGDFETVLSAQKAAGVERILVPGVDAANIDAVLDVCNRSNGYLLPAIGLHPENILNDWQEQLDTVHSRLFAPLSPYIAVGEIGLDYHTDITYKTEQIAAFRLQLQWAQQKHLPVMIHSREATEDSLDVIRQVNKESQTPLRGVMHCFSGSHEVAQQIVDMGLYLGIGGVITFKNCKLKEHLHGIPLERLVLETDAPYMTPVPYRGKRNESRFMTYVMDALGEVYGVSSEDIDRITTANAKTLFNLPE